METKRTTTDNGNVLTITTNASGTAVPFNTHDAYCASLATAQVVYDIETKDGGGVSLFTFPTTGQSVRTVQGPNGEPWFVARDVCDVLNHTDANMALLGLDADERATPLKLGCRNVPAGLRKDSLLVSESGLYTLLVRSNKPEANPFRKWVTSEVLPALRKYGYYGTTPLPVPTRQQQPFSEDQLILEAMRVLQARTDALTAQLDEAHTALVETRTELAAAQPKTTFYDAYMECDGLLTLTQAAQQFGFSGRRLGEILREKPHKWLTKTMLNANMPIQSVLDRGLMVTKARTNSKTGFPCMQSYFTPKGMRMLAVLIDKLKMPADASGDDNNNNMS